MNDNCECKNRYLGLSPEMWYCRLDDTFCSPDGTCHGPVRMSSDITEEEGGSTQERDTGERFAQRPGRKDDSEKLAYNLLPMDALDEVVKRFTHGAKNTRRITGKRWMTPWNGTALP